MAVQMYFFSSLMIVSYFITVLFYIYQYAASLSSMHVRKLEVEMNLVIQ